MAKKTSKLKNFDSAQKSRKISDITKKSKFSEIMKENPEAAGILMAEGMHCVGCPMAMHETLEQGAFAHGMDADKLMKKINKKKRGKK